MVSENGRTGASLRETLFGRGYEFEFFQAVRLLSRMFPERKPVGGAAGFTEEVVRFGAQLTLGFPPSAIHEIVERAGSAGSAGIAGSNDGPHRMTVAFFGLTGTQGVLPHFYTEYLIARAAAPLKDTAMADFLDLFNHRLISLFYRAWEKHKIYVGYERRPEPKEPDPFARYLFSLIGMGTESLRGRMPIRDESLVFYAGLIAQRPRSASALRGILRDYFQAPVEVDQCLGSWYVLQPQDRSYMDRDGAHNQLGVGAVAGDEVWDQQARFRVRVGPLPFDRFRRFLPDGDALPLLVAWVRFFAGPVLAFDVNVGLNRKEIPSCQLGDDGLAAPRLGWLSWLKTDEFESDTFDVEFSYLN